MCLKGSTLDLTEGIVLSVGYILCYLLKAYLLPKISEKDVWTCTNSITLITTQGDRSYFENEAN